MIEIVKTTGIIIQLQSRPCGFGQSLGQPIVRSISHFFCSPSNRETDQKKFRDCPKIFCPVSETGQFFFGRPEKMKNRPDNWSTKRLTKSTWTPLE